MTKFFEFSQNNSGGYFDVDKKVCHRVIIEADSEQEAISKMEGWVTFDVGCPCCGDRWSRCTEEIKFPLKYGHIRQSIIDKLKGKFKVGKKSDYCSIYKEKEYVVIFLDMITYLQYLADEYGFTKPDIRIHYKNGKTKEIFKRE